MYQNKKQTLSEGVIADLVFGLAAKGIVLGVEGIKKTFSVGTETAERVLRNIRRQAIMYNSIRNTENEKDEKKDNKNDNDDDLKDDVDDKNTSKPVKKEDNKQEDTEYVSESFIKSLLIGGAKLSGKSLVAGAKSASSLGKLASVSSKKFGKTLRRQAIMYKSIHDTKKNNQK